MSATAYNQKTIDEFHAKNGLGVGMFGNLLLLMTAVGARSGEHITTRWARASSSSAGSCWWMNPVSCSLGRKSST